MERIGDFCNQLACRWKMFRNNVWRQTNLELILLNTTSGSSMRGWNYKPIGSQQVSLRMIEIRRIIAWCVKRNTGSATQNLSRKQVFKHNKSCLYWIIHGAISDVKNNIKETNDCIAIYILENVKKKKQSQRNLKLKVILMYFIILFLQLNQEFSVVFSNSFW